MSITTWSDIYSFIKEKRVTSTKELKVQFSQSKNNLMKKLRSLANHKMITIEDSIIRVIH